MIPLRDDRPGGGAPLFALLICIALLAAGTAVPGGGPWLGLLAAFAGWLYAPSLVREGGLPLTCGIVLIGAAVAGGVTFAAGGSWGAWATVGAAAALVAAHLVRFRGSTMLALIPIPYRAGLAEVPSLAVAAIWAVPACVLAAGA